MASKQRRSVVKVGAVTTDWSRSVLDVRGYPAMGGAGWARIGQVKQRSQNYWVIGQAVEVDGRIAVTTWDDRTHNDCPIIVAQRYMQASFVASSRNAIANGQKIVNDVDDWFWGLHPENAAFEMTNPTNNLHSNTDHYKNAVLLSTAVVTSTEFLANQIRLWQPSLNVAVIPNGVDIAEFPVRRQRKSDPIIGWAGSTAHRSGDLEILRKPFQSLKKQRFHHTGHNPKFPYFGDKTGISKNQLTLTPMLAPHEYPYGLQFDIGVIPLVDIPFNHAKSNIKGLEYAAAGIPFVASPLPEYALLSEEYGIGRLAKTSRDWVKHLTELQDFDIRQEEARRQRKAISLHRLDAKRQARLWDELIWSL